MLVAPPMSVSARVVLLVPVVVVPNVGDVVDELIAGST
jgi:hypothetical protein